MEENNMESPNQPSGSSAKGIIVVLLILILVVGGYVLLQKGSNNQRAGESNLEDAEEETSGGAESGMPFPGQEGVKETEVIKEGEMAAEVKTFTVEAKNFSFTPSEIKVKKGDRVKITLNNTQGFHDLVIDEFSVKNPQANGPTTAEVEFTADKMGTFEFYCSVGKHREMGMKGNLIVE